MKKEMKKIVSIPIYVLAISVLLFSDMNAYPLRADYYHSKSWKPVYSASMVKQAGIICFPQVQLSLDHTGKVKIAPEMLLTVMPANPANYSVLVQGTKTDTVTCNDLGYKLKVHVFENGTNNSCWSYVTVEDKTAPFVICRDTTLICIGRQSDLDSIPNITLIGDNCTPLKDIRISKMDRIETRDCADDTFSVVTRMWSAIDPWGRTGTCTQTINLLRADQSDIHFPNDTTIYCPATNISPEYLGQPTIGDKPLDKFCGWAVEYDDITYIKCGESKKILRVWKILDCCALKDTSVTQFIHISDTTPPAIVCPVPYTVFTDDDQCLATFRLKRLFSVTDACNENNIDVWIKVDNQLLYTPGSIVELAPGVHDLVYQAADACGNKATCNTKVEVKDNVEPVLICPDSIFISLPASNTFIEPHYFSSIEYYDNCEIKKVEFKKSIDNCIDGIQDTIFNDTIHVCCDEINEIFDIIFKVTDTSNNMSTCTVKAYVVDKTAPILNSEQNDTITCGMPRPDWVDPDLGLVDNCLDNVKITIDTTINNFNSCGLGTIKRRIIATDPGGNADTVCQSITVIAGDGMDNTAFCALIIWPKDTILSNCAINQHPDSLKLRPEFTPDPENCTDAIFTYRDTSVASQIMGGCLNTTWRIWTAWEECTMTLMCKDTQNINVLDIDDPLLVVPADIIINLKFPSLCDTLLTSLGSAIVADCDPNVIIKNVIIGSTDTAGASLIRRYPLGVSKVYVYAKDACGNISEDTVTITVRDTIKPMAVCQKFNSYINDLGIIRVNSFRMNGGSTDNCTAADQLKISFTKNTDDTLIEVNCDHILLKRPSGDTILDTVRYFPLERYFTIWVTDASGNQDTCVGNRSLAFLDTLNVCNKPFMISGIHGKLETFNGLSIPNALVMASGEINLRNTSNVNGEYNLPGVNPGIYKMTPYKNDDHPLGLSTLDLLLIQKHITGAEPFKNADQFIAADINNDGEVTALDLIELKKVILGVQPVFNQNTSWRFFNSSLSARIQDAYALRRFENPFVETFYGQNSEQNFNGVKIGDVNRSALAGLMNLESRSDSKFEFEIENKICNENELVSITIEANMLQTEGIQGEFLITDAALVKIGTDALLNENTIYTPVLDKGKLRFSWVGKPEKPGSAENILQLIIQPKKRGYVSEFIKLSTNGLLNEAYTSNKEIKSLGIKFNALNMKNKNIDVKTGEGAHPKTVYHGQHQDVSIDVFVFPNPVISEFNIKVNNIRNSSLLNWRLMDEAGRKLKAGKFNQNIRVSMEGLNTGFYLLELQGEDKKFIYRSKIIKK